MTAQTSAQYLSTGDVGNWLGIAPPTVRMLVRNGQLRIAARTEGGIHLFLPAEVLELAERRAERPDVTFPPILEPRPPQERP